MMDNTLRCLVFVAGVNLWNHNAIGVKTESTRRIAPRPDPPCHVENSFLFTREDVQPGTTLMKLPTHAGETWSLVETEAKGYLILDNRHGGQSWVVFSKSPDLETISQLLGRRGQSLPFVLVCTFQEWIYKYRLELVVSDVNEHPPVFDPDRSYSFNISEATSVGSSVFSLRQIATDVDTTGHVSFYSLEPYLPSQVDGRHYFQLADDGNHLVLSSDIDYDRLERDGCQTLKLNLSATDNGTPISLMSFMTLTIHVNDVDDQGPAFVYPDCPRVDNFCSVPYFQTAIKCGFRGRLRLFPGEIRAIDRDTQNYSIFYSISRVNPDTFADKLEINARTGEIEAEVMPCTSSMQDIILTVTATESSPLEHSVSTNIQVKLLDNLVFPNMDWRLQVGNDQTSTVNSSVSLVVFLVTVLIFIIVGAAFGLVAVRISHNKKQNKIKSTSTNATFKLNDCHTYHNQHVKASSCFQTYNCSPQLSHSSADCESIPATLTIRADRSLTTLAVPTAVECEPQEMWTAFRTSGSNPLLGDISFSPTPSLPGRSDLKTFYDPNCSFGSMKHERMIEANRQLGKLKLTLADVVPDCVKSMAQKVRFDSSSLNQSNV